VNALPATEFLGRPHSGRVFSLASKVRLGDVDPGALMRFDSIARALQDVATDDASDAGLDRRFGWLVRRTLIDVSEPPRLGESIDVVTWCTAIGPAWAERRSQIVGERGALVDAVSLWVQVDVETGRPARIADDFRNAYGVAADGRSVSARLLLDGPTDSSGSSWHTRATDFDPYGHVNNAATWAFVEEHAALGDRRGRAEIEYLRPIEAGVEIRIVGSVRTGDAARQPSPFDAWLMDAHGVTTAARWRPAR
jgi:acyl-ACP thioesterase